MRKLLASCLVLWVSTLAFSSCTLWKPSETPSSTGSTADSGSSASAKSVVESGDTIAVDYVGRLEDGTVFDSSIQSEAQKSKNYSSGRTYEPLEFTVGAGQMIPGFDAGVVGMKLGEKKTLTIAPKDAYGEGSSDQSLPAFYFQDTFTREVDRANFNDYVERTTDFDALGKQPGSVKVGDVITEGQMEATVKSLSGSSIVLSIKNPHPFFGKKLVVGLEASLPKAENVANAPENKVKIEKITSTGVTIRVDNKENPFYGKELKEGLQAKLPDGKEITIKKLNGDTVTVSMPNTHELAGKTLIFDVEVKKITAASKK